MRMVIRLWKNGKVGNQGPSVGSLTLVAGILSWRLLIRIEMESRNVNQEGVILCKSSHLRTNWTKPFLFDAVLFSHVRLQCSVCELILFTKYARYLGKSRISVCQSMHIHICLRF